MPFDGPTESEFSAACALISAYIDHPSSGRRGARNDHLRELIGTWSFALSDNERHAAHDAEKS